MHRLALAASLVVAALLSGATAAPAVADTLPRNPDRITAPVIAGSKVNTPAGSCTVGAVLVPRSIFARLTPYQRAVRYLVIPKHCAPLYGVISSGSSPLGSVVWQSAASDVELVRVSPLRDPAALRCAAEHPSSPAFCSPFESYTPRAAGQVFSLSRGRVARQDVTGTTEPGGGGHSCTSGWVSGVQCVWQPISLPGGPLPYQHLSAMDASDLTNLVPGDSGAPVFSYSNALIGMVSSRIENSTIMLYTPMGQILGELRDYMLAPAR